MDTNAVLDLMWIVICGILVFFMQAGFTLVETGFTRAKNAGNIIMKNLKMIFAAFMMMNRNKKGIALNLKDKDGIKIFKEMVKNSDVVLENFRKGTLEKLGIGYDVMSEINPKIIMTMTTTIILFIVYQENCS